MKYFVTDRNDEVHGPYSLEEIQNLLACGSVETTALSCEEGSETWQPLSAILPPAPTPAPNAPSAQQKAPAKATPAATPAKPTVAAPPQQAPTATPPASATAPKAPSVVAPKKPLSAVLIICVVVTLALIFLGAYLLGRRL